LVYFTHARLMQESESSVQGYAETGTGLDQRVCAQLLGSRPRYATWVSGHDRRMWQVARGRERERQITELRIAATEQIHRAALVRHLRDNQIAGRERSLLLKEFYGALDAECAVIAEHRAYTCAASSQLCAIDLLTLCNDRYGTDLLGRYEREFGTFFGMHCDRARAHSDARPYLLASLMPEVKAGVNRLRARLASGARLPPARVRGSNRSPPLKLLGHSLVAHRTGSRTPVPARR
jgi:hypothetical protein